MLRSRPHCLTAPNMTLCERLLTTGIMMLTKMRISLEIITRAAYLPWVSLQG